MLGALNTKLCNWWCTHGSMWKAGGAYLGYFTTTIPQLWPSSILICLPVNLVYFATTTIPQLWPSTVQYIDRGLMITILHWFTLLIESWFALVIIVSDVDPILFNIQCNVRKEEKDVFSWQHLMLSWRVCLSQYWFKSWYMAAALSLSCHFPHFSTDPQPR